MGRAPRSLCHSGSQYPQGPSRSEVLGPGPSSLPQAGREQTEASPDSNWGEDPGHTRRFFVPFTSWCRLPSPGPPGASDFIKVIFQEIASGSQVTAKPTSGYQAFSIPPPPSSLFPCKSERKERCAGGGALCGAVVRLDAFGVKPERTVTNCSVLRSPGCRPKAGTSLALWRTGHHHLGSRNRGSWPVRLQPRTSLLWVGQQSHC